jgi:hypothetical protein
MRLSLIAVALALSITAEASAGSTLVYDGRGRLSQVIRPSPSGFVVYDGGGGITSVIRHVGFNRRPIIETGRSPISVVGTSLPVEVSGLRGGVGFD